MDNEKITGLIDKYLEGHCTPDEARIVEQWYDNYHRTNSDFYQGDRHAIHASAERSLSIVREKLGLGVRSADEPEVLPEAGRGKVRSLYIWLSAACVVIAVIVGAISLRAPKKAETFITESAGAGKVRHIRLPDGTEVWLNAGSVLRYSSAFGMKDRSIELTGEAYFDVTDDKDRPFAVRSGALHTLVLGTAFSVSAYPQALIHSVSVVRGKVEISRGAGGRDVLGDLLPNQELEYAVGTGAATLVNVNSEKTALWKTGKLSFVQMPMQDIAVHLEEWYGVRFIFKNDSLKWRRFTASFDNHISLGDLLAVMKDVSHTRYQIDRQDSTVTFY